MNSLVRVHATTLPAEAGFLRMALVDHGIECTIENENAAQYAVGLATAAAPLLLTVPEKHAETARQIIAAALRAMRKAPSGEVIPMETVHCSCGRALEVPEGSVPQSIECPFCGARVNIGETDSPGAQPSRTTDS